MFVDDATSALMELLFCESESVFAHVDKIMWGSDYPHAEGTWPHTKDRLAETFRGTPPADVARMLGGNAARVHGFDAARLTALAERIGPEVAALA